MLNREQIHYLKETALHLGYFVVGPITENGIIVSGFEDNALEYEFYLDNDNNTQIRELKQETDNKQYDLRKYKDNEFKVYEEADYFMVVVNNDKMYMLNSYIDVEEFIMNYNLL